MRQELIGRGHDYPFRLSIEDADISESRFHNALTIIQVFTGEMTCVLSGRSHVLYARDIIFINPYEIYSFSRTAGHCRLLVLSVDIDRLNALFPSDGGLFFRWKEIYNDRESDLYQELSGKLRSLVITAINQEPAYLAGAYQDVLSVLMTLYNRCFLGQSQSEDHPSTAHQAQSAAVIMRYINAHYREPLSLQNLSETLGLSAPYISRLFKETFGVGFLEYLNNMRIRESLDQLVNSDDYIIDIAISVGFNNAKTYSRLFRKIMGVLPDEYRKMYRGREESYKKGEPDLYTESDLLHFLYDGDKYPDILTEPTFETVSLEQDFAHGISKPWPKKWNEILSVGSATLLLQYHVQQEVMTAVEELHFTYIRFTGVLSDTLQIYQKTADGTVKFLWILLDEVLDFLIRNKLKPFVCLEFMPEKLASQVTDSPYQWTANSSKPISQQKWDDYLQAFLQHCINRYSRDEVNSWRFEFWNSPELTGVFWHDSDEDFFRFFLSSYRVFRRVLPDGQFGSPSQVGLNQYRFSRKFFEFCRQNKVRFDFISMHCYSLTNPQNRDQWMSRILTLNPESETEAKDYLIRSVTGLAQLLSEMNITAPVYITEWNVTPYPHDLSRDTCFMGPYIADTINRLPACVESISFWALTDYMEEHIPHQDLFTGELGLRTHNTLPKPSYLAFILMNFVGERRLSSGDGYFMTSSGRGFQIFLYNYSFYNKEFLEGNSRKLTVYDRYQIFESGCDKRFHLHLTVPPGFYRIERLFVNREQGSIYDSWIHVGAPEQIDEAAYHYLLNKGCPGIDVSYQKIEGQMLLTETVPQHGMLLIMLTMIEN